MANGVDTSIYSNIQQPQPLNTASNIISLQNQRIQQQLLQQNYTTQHLQNASAYGKRVLGYITPLLSKQDLSPDDVHEAAADMLSDPELMSSSQGQLTVQQMLPKLMDLPQNPVELRQRVLGTAQKYAAMTGQIDQYLAKPAAVNTGGQTQYVDTNPLTNQSATTQSLQNTLTPGESAARIPSVGADAQGRPVMGSVPQSTVVSPTGNPLTGNAAALQDYRQQNGMATPPVDTQRASMGLPVGVGTSNPLTGGTPQVAASALMPSSMTPQPSRAAIPPPPPANPPGFVQQAFTPGYQQSQTDQAQAGGARFNTTVQAAQDSKTRQNVLQNILDLSKQGVATGNGQAFQQNLLGVAANIPGLSEAMGPLKDDQSKFQEMKKFMSQNALRNWQAAGGTGTNEQLQTFENANPNDQMFPQAVQDMARWNMASELALQSKANAQDAWKQANGGDMTNQNNFEKAWRNNFDQRMFQIQAAQGDQGALNNLKDQIPVKDRAGLRKQWQTLQQMNNPSYWQNQ